jgi:Uri superfamily endonuclease
MTQTTYQLHIRVRKSKTIRIGKFGEFRFPAGRYIYTGSAKRNLDARVRRHLVKHKKLYWHIDYLLADPDVSVVRVRLSVAKECALNQRTRGTIPVADFGAGDCTSGCGGHLKFVGQQGQ